MLGHQVSLFFHQPLFGQCGIAQRIAEAENFKAQGREAERDDQRSDENRKQASSGEARRPFDEVPTNQPEPSGGGLGPRPPLVESARISN